MPGAPTVYLASPLGFTLPGRIFHDRTLMTVVRANGLEPLSPWAKPDTGPAYEDPTWPQVTAERNLALLRSAAGVLAVLDGADVDSGTAAEIGYAAALGRPVVGWRTDTRRAGDHSDMVVNLQVEGCVRVTGGRVCADLGEAVTLLRDLVLTRQD